MINYIKADVYRLFHKKSLYIYYSALAILFLFITYMMSDILTAQNAVDYTAGILRFLPVLFGGFIFAAVYIDDLIAKSLPQILGFGINKTFILFSKIIISTLINILFLLLALLIICMSFMAFGVKIDNIMDIMLKMLIRPVLLTTVYIAVASIAAFGTQNTAVAIIVYLFFSSGLVDFLLNELLRLEYIRMAASTDIRHYFLYTIEAIVYEIDDMIFLPNYYSFSIIPVIQYIIFLIITLFLSVLAFDKKEIEF